MKLSIDECVYGPANDNEEVLGNLTELELSWFIGRFGGPSVDSGLGFDGTTPMGLLRMYWSWYLGNVLQL